MDHVAIMRKSWGLLPKVLSGEKTIESRWYKNKSAPWGKINVGDIIYFKNSGEPVTVKAKIKKVKTIENLTPKKVHEILEKYGKDDGIKKEKLSFYYNLFKDKKYCILIFLINPKKIKPFEINKKGFGSMSAWITTQNINDIK